jgi:hypothetical protein
MDVDIRSVTVEVTSTANSTISSSCNSVDPSPSFPSITGSSVPNLDLSQSPSFEIVDGHRANVYPITDPLEKLLRTLQFSVKFKRSLKRAILHSVRKYAGPINGRLSSEIEQATLEAIELALRIVG